MHHHEKSSINSVLDFQDGCSNIHHRFQESVCRTEWQAVLTSLNPAVWYLRTMAGGALSRTPPVSGCAWAACAAAPLLPLLPLSTALSAMVHCHCLNSTWHSLHPSPVNTAARSEAAVAEGVAAAFCFTCAVLLVGAAAVVCELPDANAAGVLGTAGAAGGAATACRLDMTARLTPVTLS
jgi:hypothetical protein